MKRLILAFGILVSCIHLLGQVNTENREGTISYVSSGSVYVKFKNTDNISVGDTLYLTSNGNFVPALTVNNLSSTSCECSRLSTANFTVGGVIYARIKIPATRSEQADAENNIAIAPVADTAVLAVGLATAENGLKQRITGSIAAISYSDFSNTVADNSQRFRYTLSLDARNIGNSKFSAESYISFRHKVGEWDEVKEDVFNALKIFGLAIRYDLNKTTQFSLGRKINPRISNMGAMDGLQVEKTFGKVAVGGLVGSRPDYSNYGFNFNLLQFGAFISHRHAGKNAYAESSLAFMQQMNNSKTDRRFLYFQHANTLVRNLYFFGTFEADLYELKQDSLDQDVPQGTFTPTGVFLSLRYRLSKKFTLSGSYDARKNVMYYETYRTYLDRILENEMRQGFRLQANYNITSNILVGLQAGYRFLRSDPKPSRNMYGFVTYSQIPGVKISATISGTYLETSYMDGKILGLRLSRDLLQGKMQAGLGYRFASYRLPENLIDVTQHIGEASISWQFARNMSLSVNYEGTYEKADRYNRLYAQVRKRF